VENNVEKFYSTWKKESVFVEKVLFPQRVIHISC